MSDVTEAVIEWCNLVLEDIENVGERGVGICSNLGDYLEYQNPKWLFRLDSLIASWPEANLDEPTFPVEGYIYCIEIHSIFGLATSELNACV